MPNIHETIKQLSIEAGGPGSGRKPGDKCANCSHTYGEHGNSLSRNSGPKFCPGSRGTTYLHKVPKKNIKAGGPGSGRKPTGKQIADHLNTQVKRYKGFDNGFGKTMKYPAYKAKAVKDDSNGNSTIVVKYKGSLDKEEQPEEALHEYDLENHSIGNYRRVGSNKFKDPKTGHIVSFKTE